MSLEHELCLSSGDIPELDGTVFGAGNDPLAVRRDSDGKDVVLQVSLGVINSKGEGAHLVSIERTMACPQSLLIILLSAVTRFDRPFRLRQIPHSQRPVKRTRDERFAIG